MIISGVLFLIAILFGYMIIKIGEDACQNKIYKEAINEDGEYQAVLFSRSCGATTSISSQLSILKKTKKLKNYESGNIFIAQRIYSVPLGITYGSPVYFYWVTNDSLHIVYHPKAMVFKKETKYKSINIGYSQDSVIP
jgi:hypothetical protein